MPPSPKRKQQSSSGGSAGASAGGAVGAEVAKDAIGANTLGLGVGTGLGAGAVAAYYGPTYAKYFNLLKNGQATGEDKVKTLALTNPITAWAVPIADRFGIGGGKGKDQLARDVIRKRMLEAGLFGKDGAPTQYSLQNADGSYFDIGADGSKQGYNVDFSKEGIGNIVSQANGLANLLTGGDKKLASDFAGYLTNAAMSSGDPTKNLRGYYEKFGLDGKSAAEQLSALTTLSDADKAAMVGGINSIFGAPAPAATTESRRAPATKKPAKRTRRDNYVEPEFDPVGSKKPAPIAYSPNQGPAISVQDYIDAITRNNNYI